jgi:FG-GAP repeat
MRKIILVSTVLAASLIPKADAANWGENQIRAPVGAFRFGETVAVSRDGITALIAAPSEACAAGGACGAAYVYVRDGRAWHLQARLSASDEAAGIHFGGNDYDDNTIALSADGNIAFVGIDPRALGKGAVYAFVRTGETWSEQQKLVRPDASDTGTDGFGRSVALSDGANTVVVGDGPWFFDFAAGPKGAAYVFKRVGDHWVFNARLSGSRTEHGNGRFSAFG